MYQPLYQQPLLPQGGELGGESSMLYSRRSDISMEFKAQVRLVLTFWITISEYILESRILSVMQLWGRVSPVNWPNFRGLHPIVESSLITVCTEGSKMS